MPGRLSWLAALAVVAIVTPRRAAAQSLAPAPAAEDTSRSRIVLALTSGGRFIINNQPVESTDLPRELKLIFASRPRRVLLVWLPETPSTSAWQLLEREARQNHVTLYLTQSLPFQI